MHSHLSCPVGLDVDRELKGMKRVASSDRTFITTGMKI
jgi:hypothetical protein